MTANEAISSWEKIQQGVKEAETLMGKREYNNGTGRSFHAG